MPVRTLANGTISGFSGGRSHDARREPFTMDDRILVIDDDRELCELVTEYIQPEGFSVESVHDGLSGVERASAGEHACVVLDVMLPGLGGFEVLRRVRAVSNVPILMLTARGSDLDRIMGLEIGADDYLPKPFNPRELVARIRAIIRRTQAVRAAPAAPVSLRETVSVDDVTIDIGARTVTRSGETVELTGAEFETLLVLLREAGRVVTREALVKKALGRKLTPYDRSIDMHVSSVRRKLGPHPDSRTGGVKGDHDDRIKTVRGVGYIYTRHGAD
jgi:two-component system response regulator CpxR